MKLAIIGPVYPYRGGIAHYTTQMAQKFSQAGHTIRVFSFHRQYPAFLYPGKTDKDNSRVTFQVEATYSLDPLWPWTWTETARQIAAFEPDVVIIQWWVTFWGPAFALLASHLRRKHIPVVYLIHNVLPHEPGMADSLLARMALSQACGFIVQTSREESRLRSILPKAQIKMCPHPNYDLFDGQSMTREQARKLLGLRQEIPVALFFGIVRPYKGLHVLIDAIAMLRDQGRELPLVVAGEFWEDIQKYRDQIRELRLADLVTLDNRYIPNEEVGKYFSAADVFVAPYLGGTQSGVVKIAVSFGLPVLASDCIAADLTLESYPFRMHPAGNARALAADLLQVIDHSPQIPPASSAVDGWSELMHAIEAVARDICWRS